MFEHQHIFPHSFSNLGIFRKISAYYFSLSRREVNRIFYAAANSAKGPWGPIPSFPHSRQPEPVGVHVPRRPDAVAQCVGRETPRGPRSKGFRPQMDAFLYDNQ